MKGSRFVGYRVVEFSEDSHEALRDIYERLAPEAPSILDAWVDKQWSVWQPPGLTKEELWEIFSRILRTLLEMLCRRANEHEFMAIESIGADLARRRYPFEALIISVHFLEESYLPILLDSDRRCTQDRLLAMDEFLHYVLASISTSYFEAYRKELMDRAEVGRIVQEGLLAEIPKRAVGLEIGHVYLSARERAQLGGDFLDFFTVGSDGATFVIGDLAGHGLEAAADSVMLRSLFRGFMREKPDMQDAMARLNRVLTSELKSGLFATALAVTYDLSGTVSLVSAGHPYPVVWDGHCRMLEIEGAALAIDRSSSYALERFALPEGGMLVAYTDGLTEAKGIALERFGDKRIIDAIEEMAGLPARQVAEHLVDNALRHTGGHFQDDVVVLVIKRGGT